MRRLARDEGAYRLVPARGAPSAPAGGGWRLWRCGRLSAIGAQGQRGSHSADSQTSADVSFCRQRKWPEAKIFIDLEPLRNFNVRAKVVGPGVSSERQRQLGQGADSRVCRVCSSSTSRARRARACRSRARAVASWTRRRGARATSACTLLSREWQSALSATSRTTDALSGTADRTRRWCRRAR